MQPDGFVWAHVTDIGPERATVFRFATRWERPQPASACVLVPDDTRLGQRIWYGDAQRRTTWWWQSLLKERDER